MAYENLNLRKPHFAYHDNYFYNFREDNGTLDTIIADGTVAFTYPILGTLGSNAVKSCEHDGFYLWSMQTGSVSTQDISIKKWLIENNICKLIDTYDFIGDNQHRWDSSAFTLENYNTTFKTTISGGATSVCLSDYAEKAVPGTRIILGPNSEGEYETVTATGTSLGDYVNINFYTENTYQEGDPINFNKSLFIFNDYGSGAAVIGTLYKFDMDMVLDTYIEDDEYDSVDGCTFGRVLGAVHMSNTSAIVYNKYTNVRFLDPEDMSLLSSMTIDNINTVGSVYTIYDMVLINKALFRLQKGATYYESNYSWTYYSYVISPIRNYIDSVVVDALPVILPSDGVSASTLYAFVKDQYGRPIFNKPVSFVDDDDTGFVTIETTYTWTDGVATNTYKAGITPATVTVVGTVTQLD